MNLSDHLWRFIRLLGRVAYCGIGENTSAELSIIMLALIVLAFCAGINYWHLILPGWYLPHRFLPIWIWFAKLVSQLGPLLNGIACAVGMTFLFLLALGIAPYHRLKKLQASLDLAGFSNGTGSKPMIVREVRSDNNQRTLIVKSEGVGVDRYKNKQGDLETAFGDIIANIALCADRRFVSLSLVKGVVPMKCTFKELSKGLDSPHTFVVGESLSGPIYQDITALPHLLVAGTTGGGKSVFFKQLLLGLLHSSPRVRFYLIDLKNGVDMQFFEELPNVRVVTSEVEAVQVLTEVNAEMDRRLVYLKDKKVTKVDFERDKMDLIVVGVDEASVIYTRSRGNSSKNDNIDQARELTDRLTKLARAAGISVVLATQKVTKETIDTKIQENIGGRMVFKMNTLQGSMTVLGNKMAMELPDNPGRGIWSIGNKMIEVQAPFMSEPELTEQLEVLKEEFESGERKTSISMIPVPQSNVIELKALTKKPDEPTDDLKS